MPIQEGTLTLGGDTVRPSSKRDYYCESCGTELDDGRKKYCEDCKPANRPAQRAPSRARAKAVSTLTPNKASGTFARLLVIITAMLAWARLRQQGIPDYDGRLSEELAFTDEEAAAVSRPLGRFATSNETVSKIVAPIVDNEDIIDALFALWEYNKRTSAILDQYKRELLPEQSPTERQRRRVVTQSSEESADASGEWADPIGEPGGNPWDYS